MRDREKYYDNMDMDKLQDKLTGAVQNGIEASKKIERKKRSKKMAIKGIAAGVILCAGIGLFKSNPRMIDNIRNFSIVKNTPENKDGMTESLESRLQDKYIGHTKIKDGILGVKYVKYNQDKLFIGLEIMNEKGELVEIEHDSLTVNDFVLKDQDKNKSLSSDSTRIFRSDLSSMKGKPGEVILEIKMDSRYEMLWNEETEKIFIDGTVVGGNYIKDKDGEKFEYHEIYKIKELAINMKDVIKESTDELQLNSEIDIDQYKVTVEKIHVGKVDPKLYLKIKTDEKNMELMSYIQVKLSNEKGEEIRTQQDISYWDKNDLCIEFSIIDDVFEAKELYLKDIYIYEATSDKHIEINYELGILSGDSDYYEVFDHNKNDEYYEFKLKRKKDEKFTIEDRVFLTTTDPQNRWVDQFKGASFITDATKDAMASGAVIGVYRDLKEIQIRLDKNKLKDVRANKTVKVYFRPESITRQKTECDIKIYSKNNNPNKTLREDSVGRIEKDNVIINVVDAEKIGSLLILKLDITDSNGMQLNCDEPMMLENVVFHNWRKNMYMGNIPLKSKISNDGYWLCRVVLSREYDSDNVKLGSLSLEGRLVKHEGNNTKIELMEFNDLSLDVNKIKTPEIKLDFAGSEVQFDDTKVTILSVMNFEGYSAVEYQVITNKRFDNRGLRFEIELESEDGKHMTQTRKIDKWDKYGQDDTLHMSFIAYYDGKIEEAVEIKKIKTTYDANQRNLMIDVTNGTKVNKDRNSFYNIVDYADEDEYYQFRLRALGRDKIAIFEECHILSESEEGFIAVTSENNEQGVEFITTQQPTMSEFGGIKYEDCEEVTIRVNKKMLKEHNATKLILHFETEMEEIIKEFNR